jgi:glycosyltransferase involved in cell wall biosynthesis
MEIHQIVHAAAPGDAVTNSALEWRALLRQVGPSEVFATHVDARLVDDVLPLGAYYDLPSARAGGNLLLYHLSIGAPETMAFLRSRRERLGVVYHNISPAEYFDALDERFAAELRRGRDELVQLADRASFAFADSPYNGRELDAVGYRSVQTVPLVVDAARLRGIEPDEGFSAWLDTQLDGPLVLYVGQILPHKRPDLVLSAYHVLSTYLLPEACAVLAGSGRLARYRFAVQRYARELNLYKASLLGWVTDEQLAALYRRADLFVTASEHEGFCVPLLEAMAWDIPVVARRFAAVPETLGGAGLLVDPDDGPLVLAEAMDAALTDPAVRNALVDSGRARLEDYRPDNARNAFLAALAEVA